MNNKGDIWISTVLYTLIGLAIMGSLVAILQPRIAELKDKIITDQTLQSLNVLDDTILRVREATGTRLNFILSLDKGNFIIDGINEAIYWQYDSNYQYSEENKTINPSGERISVLTQRAGKLWNTNLMLSYNLYNINITVNNESISKTLTPSGIDYSIWITNKGIKDKVQQIDFSV